MDQVGLKNKIRWLQQAVANGDYYSQFLLAKLQAILKAF